MSLREEIVSNLAWIRRRATQYCRDEYAAEDLASETVLKCLSQRRRLEKGRDIRPWLSAVMANTYRSHYNRRQRVVFTGYYECTHTAAPCEADRHTLDLEIRTAVERLRRRYLCVESVLLYIDGYNYDEIASRTGVCLGTVKSRIREGRKVLRRHLADNF